MINPQEFLKWLPPQIRQQQLLEVKGQTAVKFPAAYFFKVPGSQSPGWVNLTTPDPEGLIIKTAPNKLVVSLILTLEKYKQEYQKIEL